MGLETATVILPIRAPLPKPRRRTLLVATVAASALAHVALLAFLLGESAARPDAGTVIEIEIAAMPGTPAASEAAGARAGSPGAALARPAALPDPAPAPSTRPPQSASVPPTASPDTAEVVPPVPPRAAPATVTPPPVSSTADAPAPRAAPSPPAATKPAEPEAAVAVTPPPLPVPKEIARAEAEPKSAPPPVSPAEPPPPQTLAKPAPLRPPPAAEPATAQPRAKPPQLAAPSRAVSVRPAAKPTATDVASAETANDAAPGAGQPATPPRYGLGSAANPLPRYPEVARERGWEGVVVLTVAVSVSGTPDSVAVTRSSGHSALDQAALDAVRRWRFEPARRIGIAIAGTVSVPIRFRLSD